jgi:hypothetical protein
MSQSNRFEALARLWEGTPSPSKDQTVDGYYAEVAGSLAFAVHDEVADLRKALDQLQACPEIPAMTTLEAIKTEPTIRVRLQHSHTLKEGWRLSETTVEWTGEGNPDWKAIEGAQQGAFAVGANEARFRNLPQPTGDEDGGE